ERPSTELVLDLDAATAELHTSFERERALVRRAIEARDSEAIQELLSNPKLDRRIRAALESERSATQVEGFFATVLARVEKAMGEGAGAWAELGEDPQVPRTLRERIAVTPFSSLREPSARAA